MSELPQADSTTHFLAPPPASHLHAPPPSSSSSSSDNTKDATHIRTPSTDSTTSSDECNQIHLRQPSGVPSIPDDARRKTWHSPFEKNTPLVREQASTWGIVWFYFLTVLSVFCCCQRPRSRHSLYRAPRKWPFLMIFAMANAAGIIVSCVVTSPIYDLVGFSIYCSRSAAAVILCTAGIILFTVSKHLFAIIRLLPYSSRFIPFDSRVTFHKLMGVVILVATAVHIAFHYVTIYKLTHSLAPADIHAVIGDKYGFTPTSTPSMGYLLLTPRWGWTGHAMWAILLIMGITSLPSVRQSRFNLFWISHQLAYLFVALLIAHGTDAFLSFPRFWGIVLLSLIIFLAEKIYQYTRPACPILVDHCRLLDDVTKLCIERPPGVEFLPGQYICIRIPNLSIYEWHPFSLTSSPMNKHFLTLHIGDKGDWTHALRQLLEKKVSHPNILRAPTFAVVKHVDLTPKPKETDLVAYVDGPFGSSSQHTLSEEHVVMIGAGIGITPFASLLLYLRDVLYHRQHPTYGGPKEDPRTRQVAVKRIRFIWVCRSLTQLQWFVRLLRELDEDESTHEWLHMSFFVTNDKSRPPEHKELPVLPPNSPKHAANGSGFFLLFDHNKHSHHESHHHTVGQPHVPDTIAEEEKEASVDAGAEAGDVLPPLPAIHRANTYDSGVPGVIGPATTHSHGQPKKKKKSNLRLYYSRPSIRGILSDFARQHQAASQHGFYTTDRVGVYFCGPSVFGQEIERTCEEMNIEHASIDEKLERRNSNSVALRTMSAPAETLAGAGAAAAASSPEVPSRRITIEEMEDQGYTCSHLPYFSFEQEVF